MQEEPFCSHWTQAIPYRREEGEGEEEFTEVQGQQMFTYPVTYELKAQGTKNSKCHAQKPTHFGCAGGGGEGLQ